MEIIFILFLVVILGILLFMLYKIIRWIVRKKIRVVWALSVLGMFVVTITINHFFFKKMEFIQSKVYPNLFLVKNQIKDRDSLNSIIKKMVSEKMDDDILVNGKRYSKNTHEAPYATLVFYNYTKSFKFNIFQDYGTAYFVENEEDLGGMVVEDLSMYRNYKLAAFNIIPCKNDTTLFCGVLDYYKEGYKVKTDTLLKQ